MLVMCCESTNATRNLKRRPRDRTNRQEANRDRLIIILTITVRRPTVILLIRPKTVTRPMGTLRRTGILLIRLKLGTRPTGTPRRMVRRATGTPLNPLKIIKTTTHSRSIDRSITNPRKPSRPHLSRRLHLSRPAPLNSQTTIGSRTIGRSIINRQKRRLVLKSVTSQEPISAVAI